MPTSRETSILYDERTAAYAAARRTVFDLPDWTPLMDLTLEQVLCIDRLAQAESAVRADRRAA